LSKPALVIMCGDHGVTNEGVTQCSSGVTKIVCDNFEKSESTVCIMADSLGVDVYPVDVGVDCERYINKELIPKKICDRKIKRGTSNILFEDAMSIEEAENAILCGINTVCELKNKGYNIILTGEMGIGNTTPSSVLSSVLLGLDAIEVTGKGAGLSEEGYKRKIEVVRNSSKRVLEKYRETDYLNIFASCGGIEILAMTGLFIGGSVHKVPVIADGFISLVSALMAVKLNNKCKDYILASHNSSEKAVSKIIEYLRLDTYIDCSMCLGEGTGAISFYSLLKLGAEVYNNMKTFEEVSIEQYEDFGDK